jgi:exodeoxyribonuclease VII small subunit
MTNRSRSASRKSKTAAKPALDPGWHYESAVDEVEAIIDQIESGELDIAATLQQFETAVERLRQCESFLNHHQQQLDLVIETLSDQVNSPGFAIDDDF